MSETPHDDEDDALLSRALDAWQPEVEIPAGFAERVAREAVSERSARSARSSTAMRVLAIAASIALVIGAGSAAYARRRIEGAFAISSDAREAREVALGARAAIVAEPGTEGRFAIGGLVGSEPDVLWLERGALFARVSPGGPFEVRTPHGNVRVTGTCFEVWSGESEDAMSSMSGRARMGWFGAGALSAALIVVVHEGAVRVQASDGSDEVAVSAGEALVVETDGTITRATRAGTEESPLGSSAPHLTPVEEHAAAAARGTVSTSAREPELAREVQRLRDILSRHAISPQTGEVDPTARRGLAEEGNTDLTPDEWATLAQRGELRYRLPGAATGESITPAIAEARGLDADERARAEAILRESRAELEDDVRALYRTAIGVDPGDMSMLAMISEIEDHTDPTIASRIRWVLSQERAGIATDLDTSSEPYDGLMRLLVGYESRVEDALTELLGADRAHAVLFGTEPTLSGHGFGASGRR